MDCLLHWNIPDRGAVPWPGPQFRKSVNGVSLFCTKYLIVVNLKSQMCGWIYGIVCRYRTQNANEILPSIVELECFHYAYLCVLCLD